MAERKEMKKIKSWGQSKFLEKQLLEKAHRYEEEVAVKSNKRNEAGKIKWWVREGDYSRQDPLDARVPELSASTSLCIPDHVSSSF